MFVLHFLSTKLAALAGLGAIFICLSIVATQAGENDFVVAAAGGQIRGHAWPENKGVVFKGAPFAAPPQSQSLR